MRNKLIRLAAILVVMIMLASTAKADLIAWYTQAWFDKYLKGDPSADSRLLTSRWLSDQAEAAIDPDHDGNMFSFYFP